MIDVPNASPRYPSTPTSVTLSAMLTSTDPRRHHDRHAAAAEGVERRRHDPDDRIADQADGIELQRRGGRYRVGRRKVAVLENHRDNRPRQDDQPNRRRQVEQQHQAERVRERRSNARVIPFGHHARNRRRRGRRDRDAEQPDRQIHQAKCEIEPRHGAGAFARRQHGVDEDVDLRRRHAERARAHEEEHAMQALVFRRRGPAMAESFARSGGHWMTSWPMPPTSVAIATIVIG